MKHWLTGLMLSLFGTVVLADEAAIRRAIQPVLNGLAIESVVRTNVPGLFEVVVDKRVLYVDESGRYILDGQLIETSTRRNLTEERLHGLNKVAISELPLELAIRRIRGNGERTLITFEDPNCGYCKRMAKDVKSLPNVTIYTFLFPVLGPDSVAKAKTVWCSDERANAWSAWMEDDVPLSGPSNCYHPIDRLLELGRKLRVSGTPTLVLKDGSRISGAISLPELEKKLAAAEGTSSIAGLASPSRAGTANSTDGGGSSHRHGGAQGQADCRSTLAFLGSRIPTFAASELQAGRNSVLGQSVREAIAGAKAQGYTAESAVKATLEQAREFDRISREAAQCAADVDAMGASDEQFLAWMRQGQAPANCRTGIRSSCICAGVINRMAAVATRALAAEMQCFIRSGRW